MNTSTTAAVATGVCLIAWVIKSLAYQRANDCSLSLLSLMREMELQKRTVPEPTTNIPANKVAVASNVEPSKQTADTPKEPEATKPQAQQ